MNLPRVLLQAGEHAIECLDAAPSGPLVRFILEVNQGRFDRRGIRPGTRVAGPVFLQ